MNSMDGTILSFFVIQPDDGLWFTLFKIVIFALLVFLLVKLTNSYRKTVKLKLSRVFDYKLLGKYMLLVQAAISAVLYTFFMYLFCFAGVYIVQVVFIEPYYPVSMGVLACIGAVIAAALFARELREALTEAHSERLDA